MWEREKGGGGERDGIWKEDNLQQTFIYAGSQRALRL